MGPSVMRSAVELRRTGRTVCKDKLMGGKGESESDLCDSVYTSNLFPDLSTLHP